MQPSEEYLAEVHEPDLHHAARVLLAERDPALRGLLADLLRVAGYHVTAVEDGSELLDQIGSQLLDAEECPRSHLVIAGADLSPISGTYALAALRELAWQTPFVLICEDEHRYSAMASRLDALILEKPVCMTELLSEVARLLARQTAPLGGSATDTTTQAMQILDAVEEMVTIHDADFNIVAANRAAREALRIPERSTGRAKCFMYYHGSQQVPDGCPSCRVVSTHETTVFKMYNHYLGRPVEITAIPRFDRNGTFCGVVHITRDLSIPTDAEEALRESREQFGALREEVRRLEIQANTDYLTGAYNRRWLERNLEHEIERAERHGRAFSVAIFDVDELKTINDRLGHNNGDIVLKRVAHVVRSRLRRIDSLTRWGGDEFVLVLPETSLDEALVTLERLRSMVAQEEPPEGGVLVSISVGVTAFAQGDTPQALIDRADKALYRAKRERSGQVEIEIQNPDSRITQGSTPLAQ